MSDEAAPISVTTTTNTVWTRVALGTEKTDELYNAIRRVCLLCLDFDGVLTSNQVWLDEQGRESAACWRGDGIGLAMLRELGIGVWVISGEHGRIAYERCAKLDIPCSAGVADKRAELDRILMRQEFTVAGNLSQVAYVGNDINDLAVMRAVGLPIAVADAHDDVIAVAKYVTVRDGGYGAVREVCDLFARVLREHG